MVRVIHFCFQLITGLANIFLHLLPLLFLHVIERLPPLGVFKLKGAWPGKTWGVLSLSE